MATLFISDVHLSAQRPDIGELFRAFLASRAREAQALYILGDLFEAWIGDDAVLPEYRASIESLRSLSATSVPVYVMHGNRDFLLGTRFEAMTGARLLAEPTRIDLYGTPTLLLHGDTLCTDDVDYQRFRAMVRNPAWQQQLLSKTPEERIALAKQYREMSLAQTAIKASDIMDVNQGAVAATLREHKLLQMIHGHTHRPAIHDFSLDGTPARRIVLGDWYEQGSLLSCDESGCRLDSLV